MATKRKYRWRGTSNYDNTRAPVTVRKPDGTTYQRDMPEQEAWQALRIRQKATLGIFKQRNRPSTNRYANSRRGSSLGS